MAASEAKIVVYVNEYGEVIDAKNVDGSDIQYDPKEQNEAGFRRIVGSRTKLYTPNGCCWRLVSGVWKCHSSYCT